jgi:hypothetical protein
MPTLRNHTHCQVAQKSKRTNQNLSKSMAAPMHRQAAEDKALKHNNKYIYMIDEICCKLIL